VFVVGKQQDTFHMFLSASLPEILGLYCICKNVRTIRNNKLIKATLKIKEYKIFADRRDPHPCAVLRNVKVQEKKHTISSNDISGLQL
jgi:hypothetical protein